MPEVFRTTQTALDTGLTPVMFAILMANCDVVMAIAIPPLSDYYLFLLNVTFICISLQSVFTNPPPN